MRALSNASAKFEVEFLSRLALFALGSMEGLLVE